MRIVRIVAMIVLVIVVLVADKLIGAIARVAKVHGADIFKVMEAFLGGDGKSVVVAVVVSSDQKEEGISADARGTVGGAIVLDEGNVGLVAAVIGAVGSGAHGSTINEGPFDVTRLADFVVVMEVILYLVGHGAFVAIVVMGLDDVPVLLALRGGAVRIATTRLEDHEGIHHGAGIGAINGKVELFGHASALFGVVAMAVVVAIGSFLGDGLNIDTRRICGGVKEGKKIDVKNHLLMNVSIRDRSKRCKRHLLIIFVS